MADQPVGDQRHAKGGDDSIQSVAKGRAKSGNEARQGTVVQRTMDAKHRHRTHRHGDDQADAGTLGQQQQHLKQIGHRAPFSVGTTPYHEPMARCYVRAGGNNDSS